MLRRLDEDNEICDIIVFQSRIMLLCHLRSKKCVARRCALQNGGK